MRNFVKKPTIAGGGGLGGNSELGAGDGDGGTFNNKRGSKNSGTQVATPLALASVHDYEHEAENSKKSIAMRPKTPQIDEE